MLIALLRGLILGFIGCIPVGPVNAAVIDTALRKSFNRAVAIGMGGAFVDFLYCQLSVTVLGPLMTRFPGMSVALLGIGGVVLVLLGILTAWRPRLDREEDHGRPIMARELIAAFGAGALITLLNPAAIVSWALLSGTLLADMSRWEQLVAGAGLFVGTSSWFLLVAWLADKGRVKLGQRAAWITRTVGVLLVVYGVFLVGKASFVVWAHR